MKKIDWRLFGVMLAIFIAFIIIRHVQASETKAHPKTYAVTKKIPNPVPGPKSIPSESKPATPPSSGKETAMNTSTKNAVEPSSSNQNRSLQEILKAYGDPTGDGMSIMVQKREHILSLYIGSQKIKSYHVELGDSGLDDKAASGDHKTPEGIFYITEKSVLNPPDEFLGTRWMRLSYPNIEDAKRGLNHGIINETTYDAIVAAIRNGETPPQDTALGGGVGIHGGTTAALGPNWTWGCVGLNNQDVNEFFDYMKVGTPVVIRN